ncbi:MAG: hypothetical protein JNL79_20185, partial [Myxococcales bacterium]|nr:hypothetical protein [Myxococcales bacterium]
MRVASLLVLLAGCAYDFDGLQATEAGASDAVADGVADTRAETTTDAACTSAPASCTDAAKTCADKCRADRTTCEGACGGSTS